MAEQKIEDIKILVTDRPENPEDKSVLHTPARDANVQIVTVTWYSQVGIRVLRTYLQGLVGFLLAAGTGAAAAVGVNMPVGDFGALFIQSASLAVAPAAISFLQNAIEILTKLDTSNPVMRA